jgi:hypothetical protein
MDEERGRDDLEILTAEIEYGPWQIVFPVFCTLSGRPVALLFVRLFLHAVCRARYDALADTRVDSSVRV